MKSRFEITFWATMLVITLVGSGWGLYALLVFYFGIQPAGALMLIIPAMLVTCLASVYGFYYGIQHMYAHNRETSKWQEFERRFRIAVFGLVAAIPGVLALFFLLVTHDVTIGVLFGIIAVSVSIWVTPKITVEVQNLRRSRTRERQEE